MHATAPTDPKLPINYVFIDYENVHDIDLTLIGSKTVYFTLFLGAPQKKLDATLVEKLLAHASSVQLIRLTSSGRNALDFTLSYYLGKAAAADPTAYFHIVSKDTGFDPLIAHLNDRHIRVRRYDSFASITFTSPAKTPPPTTPDEEFAQVTDHLRKSQTNRPKNKKTFLSHLPTMAGKPLTEAEAEALLNRLLKSSLLTLNDKDRLTYSI